MAYCARTTLFFLISSITISAMEQPDMHAEKDKCKSIIFYCKDSDVPAELPLDTLKECKIVQTMLDDFADDSIEQFYLPIYTQEFEKIYWFLQLLADHTRVLELSSDDKKTALTQELISFLQNNIMYSFQSLKDLLDSADKLEIPLLLETGSTIYAQKVIDKLKKLADEPEQVAFLINKIEQLAPGMQEVVAEKVKAELQFIKSCEIPAIKYKHFCSIKAFCLNKDGTITVAGTEDKNIKIWGEIGNKASIKNFTSHNIDLLTRVYMSADGTTIASATDSSGTIQIWNVEAGKIHQTFFAGVRNVIIMNLNNDGSRIIVCGTFDTIVLNSKDGSIIDTFKLAEHEYVKRVCLSPDGTRGAMAFFCGTIRILNVQKDSKVTDIHAKQYDKIDSICMHPNNILLVIGLRNGAIELWDIVTQTCIKELKNTHHPYVAQVCFSPDGNTLVSGNTVVCSDMISAAIQLWDIEFMQRTLKTVTLPQTVILYALEHNLLTLPDIKNQTTLKSHFSLLNDDLHNHYDLDRTIKPTWYSTLKKWVPSMKTTVLGASGLAALAYAVANVTHTYSKWST